MLLKSLSTVGLHGALALDVRFNPDITLLVGINGSGKTSVLNVVDWLLKPDLQRLALAEYSSLTLRFMEKDLDYELTAEKHPSSLILSISGTKAPLKPITVRLHKASHQNDEDEDESYRGLSPEKHEMPMWELLKSFAKPTVISLDRSVAAESDEVQYVETARGTIHRRVRSQSPITYVQEVTSSRYAEFRSKAIENDNELKAKIVMSALQDPELTLRGEAIKPMTRDQITRLEEKVANYLSGTIKSTDVQRQVHRFFDASRLLTERQRRTKGKRSFVVDFVISQYRQIESLAKAFNDFETKNSLAFRSLHDYLRAINRFLNDSNKELYFDESTGKLVFSFADSGQTERSGRSVAHLSSGERQILILFTFLAFASKPRSVFIVDEPELSLHPKWQSDFMDVFLSLRPEGTQLLLATHSPDIVGKYKKNCVVLSGSRP
jgi:predicted ATP-dependent endonuclease of OLD family